MATVQKFLQHIDLNYDWFAGNGGNELGINDVNLSATFAFPLFFNSQTPLLVTPGFAAHYWAGPVSVCRCRPSSLPRPICRRRPSTPISTPPGIPWVTRYFGGELEARIGVYSDFYSVIGESIRFTGKGLAVIKLSPHMTLKAGMWYLNRVSIQLLPAGGSGLDAQPRHLFRHPLSQPESRQAAHDLGQYRVVALRPRRIRRRGLDGPTQSRHLQRPAALNYPSMSHDLVDYDDIRIAAGLEFKTLRRLNGYFEVGLVLRPPVELRKRPAVGLLSQQHRLHRRGAVVLRE